MLFYLQAHVMVGVGASNSELRGNWLKRLQKKACLRVILRAQCFHLFCVRERAMVKAMVRRDQWIRVWRRGRAGIQRMDVQLRKG